MSTRVDRASLARKAAMWQRQLDQARAAHAAELAKMRVGGGASFSVLARESDKMARAERELNKLRPVKCACGHNPMIPSGAHIEGCPAYGRVP